MTMTLSTPDDVLAAARRLEPVAVRTPLLRSDTLDRATGGRVFLKPECLQVTGSFKIRGAYNRISQLSEAERARGTVAFSSGNHAQGVAEAGRRLGVATTIVMPADAPAAKRDGAARRGATLVLYDRARESREAIARDIAEREGLALTPSYDNSHVIAGQGTVGLEAVDQLEALGERADVALCCVGGGGLIGGIGLGLEARGAALELYGVEPQGFDDHARSMKAGRRVGVDPNAVSSICDAVLAPIPGELTFAINQPRLAGGLVVTDAEALAAMAFAYRHLKLVVEPGGVLGLAAAITGKIDLRGRTALIVLTGGNVDPDVFARALEL